MRYLYSLIQKTIELIGRNSKGIPILMFHQVNDDTSVWQDKNISIKTSSFESFIISLQQNGFTFISIDKIDSISNEKAIVITFDDVFQDAIENAVSYLNSRNIPYCLFISDCFVDKDEYISKEQICELANNPLCTVGYHSKSHSVFRKMGEEEINVEVDCTDFQRQLNQTVKYFAFPYGSVFACGFRKAKLVKEKYRYSFSTIAVKCSDDWIKRFPYYLPRINVNEGNYLTLLDLK